MTYELASFWVSTIGTLSLVGTLIFSACQTAEMKRQFIGSPHDRVHAQMLAMNQVFIDHPNMRPYFYEGKPIERTHDEYYLALSIAEMRLDFFDTVVKQDQLFSKQWNLDRWRPYIVWALKQSPVMRSHLDEMRFTYSGTISECLLEAEAALTQK